MLKLVALTSFALLSIYSFSQETLDELLIEEERTDLPDTQRVKLYNDIFTEYLYSDVDQAAIYAFKSKNLAEKISYKRGIFSSYNNLGKYYMRVANYDSSIFYLEKSENLLKKHSYSGVNTYTDLGNAYFYMSDYEAALDYYLKCLDASKTENDSIAMGKCYGNIGNVYYYLQDIPKVKQNFLKSLEIKEALLDSSGIAHTLGNMGNLYYDQQDFDSSIYYFNRGLMIFESQGNLFGMSLCLSSMGDAYRSMGMLDKAENSLNKSIELGEKVGDQHGIMRNYHSLAAVLHKRGKYQDAVKAYEEAIKMSEEIQSLEYMKDGYLNLSKIQEENGDYFNALSNFKNYHNWQDSIFTEKKRDAIATLTAEFKTKEVEDSLRISQQKEELATIKAEKSELESSRKSRLLWIALGGIFLMAFSILLIFQNYRQKKKANHLLEKKNEEISKQRDIIQEKHNEISDSINYAKRIQTAILPPKRELEKNFKEYFVLYKPKDVVAGDFYWIGSKGGKKYIAAADCTGHGVPGAMVSVVCNNALNRSLNELNKTKPSDILDQTRDLVIQEFEKSDEEVKDGMDIALCSIQDELVEYSGAHNPLWVIRSGSQEIEEIKADKQPIGKFEFAKPFTNHQVKLSKGDIFYLFSDGFVDQFGGEKGKKLKAKALKRILIENADKPLSEQHSVLNAAFENWRGDFEQVDDVCLIGVRI